ncbi:MAG: hypothetical protein ABIT71_24510 [Vicinamibacteraceae bacterium]
MLKSSLLGLTALAAVLSAGVPAGAQTTAAPAAAPEPYTFVAQWQVPRAQWGTFVADFDKNTRPVLEKLGAGGTLVSWGAFESIVHTPDGYTHGVWWTGTSYAAMEKARRELLPASAASTSLTGATGHRDYFMRSIVYASKPASGEGYLTVSSYLLKAGKAQEWKQLWDKGSKPVFDDLLAKGALVAYSIDVEDVHTDSPMWRMVVTVSPTAEADDQYGAAFDAVSEKLTPDERRTRALMMDAVLEPGAHRDMYARIIRHWQK